MKRDSNNLNSINIYSEKGKVWFNKFATKIWGICTTHNSWHEWFLQHKKNSAHHHQKFDMRLKSIRSHNVETMIVPSQYYSNIKNKEKTLDIFMNIIPNDSIHKEILQSLKDLKQTLYEPYEEPIESKHPKSNQPFELYTKKDHRIGVYRDRNYTLSSISKKKEISERCYIITDGEFYKIGKSKHPNKRLKQLQIASPKKLELIYSTSLLTEDQMHTIFSQYRIRGEWFKIKEEELEKAIKGIKLLESIN